MDIRNVRLRGRRVADIGACFIWAPGDRLCQLTPASEHQVETNQRLKVIDEDGGLQHWSYSQPLRTNTSVELSSTDTWTLANGSGGNMFVIANLRITIFRYKAVGEAMGEAAGEADLRHIRVFLSFHTGHDLMNASDVRMPGCACWPALFRCLPWDHPVEPSTKWRSVIRTEDGVTSFPG